MDCSEKLTREHFISHQILKALDSGSGFNVSGLNWLKDSERKLVSPNSLASRILCERHNSALSPLDQVAVEFFGFFRKQSVDQSSSVFLVNGGEIERWYLKTLCGFIVSGNAHFEGWDHSAWKPSRSWLEILFGDLDVGLGGGLYHISAKYHTKDRQFICSPQVDRTIGEPIALVFGLAPMLFILSMRPLEDNDPVNGITLSYRPKAIRVIEDKLNREAHLGWKDGPLVSVRMKADNR